MSWLSVAGATIYVIYLPIATVVHFIYWLLSIVLVPVIHFTSGLITIVSLPFRWLAKFETLAIYLAVAAAVGLATGLLLHFSSSLLVVLFNMSPTPEVEKKGRTAASVRAAREQKVLEDAWKSSSTKQVSGDRTGSDSLEEQYTQWMESNAGKRRKKGLAGQTILEEDDDSMDGF